MVYVYRVAAIVNHHTGAVEVLVLCDSIYGSEVLPRVIPALCDGKYEGHSIFSFGRHKGGTIVTANLQNKANWQEASAFCCVDGQRLK